MNTTTGQSDCVLETTGLTKRFGGVSAIDSVSFKIQRGELRCLIGPNGAGKSTFFKMLTAQHRPTAGNIVLNGVDITGWEPHAVSRAGLGIKNQVPDVFDNLTARENIWLAASYFGKAARPDRVVDETMERLGIAGLARKRVGELAHGQRQWVELAMVVSRDPVLILLDEPTAGMTEDETARTAELILEMNKSRSIIVVEHDMQFIRKIAKTVTVFHQGKILAEDTMANIQNNEMVRDVYLGRSAAA
ncbi:ATP-binding cassette domain-containing protein [Pseudaminobacter sp. NGMCC 1.201702]|uniref:ATP-binding cassette domain-containing protein n=1 Tax=Pseudaminobacter sp. NGMCC 1.201702 TaxID=3391825 RepID=UPI0039F0A532